MKPISKFWLKKASIIEWNRFPRSSLKKDGNRFTWFEDGKINLTFNCIEANINKGLGRKVAIYNIDKFLNVKKYTYNDLKIEISKYENLIVKILKNKIENKNIMIHMSASIECASLMLTCAKIGSFFSVVFDNLPVDAIKLRIKLLKPKIFFSKNNNTKFLSEIKNYCKKNKINCSIVTIGKNNYKLYSKKKLITFNNFNYQKYNFFKSNKKLFALFTSGSTGIPKGIIHSTGGYLLYSKYTCIEQFGINQKSIVMCASDAGWINGHTYALFGPLSNGASTILLENPILILNNDALNLIIQKLNATVLYLPVTLIRMLKSIYKNKKFHSNYVKAIGSMGEPLANSVGNWFSNFFTKKKQSIVNTYFQTETGGIIASPKYNENFDGKITVGKSVNKYLKIISKNKNEKFDVKIKNLWPGCMIDTLNGNETWNNYWEKDLFKMFDIGSFDKKNRLIIHGRNDDVINVRGHRIGSEELESIILKNNNVIETAVIAINDKIEGSKIVVFYSSNTKKNIKNSIVKIIQNNFGDFLYPHDCIKLSAMPRTKSGKILRRLLRNIYLEPKKKLKDDISTMLNPKIILELKKKINEK